MPGAITVTLLEANLAKETHELPHKSFPYCLVSVGGHKIEDEVPTEGVHPKWGEPLLIERTVEPYCFINLKEKTNGETDKPIGTCEIDLEEVEPKGQITKWYDVYNKENLIGHILVETVFKSTQ